MSTARDSGDDEGFTGHVNQPNGDLNTSGTWRQSDAAAFGGASEERLLTPVPADSAARPRFSVAPAAVGRPGVLRPEQQRFGGIKVGSAFLGWMAALGVAVLLAAAADGGRRRPDPDQQYDDDRH